MQFIQFVGIDISKESFDVCLSSEAKPSQFTHKKFANSAAGCQQLLGWLKKLKARPEQCFFAMEHTGWYTLELCCFLQDKQLAFALYSPLHLKRSLGLARGKNDRVDAQRLAQFAFLHRHDLNPTQLPSSSLLKLKNLFAFRERLVKNQAALKQTIQDLKDTAHLVDNRFIIKESEKQLKLIKQQVERTEEQIEDAIQEDEQLQKTLRLLCSIPGIGLVTAVALILATNNFTAFTDGRKFASYCGVAPFEHTSGTSIRGGTRTSHLANKRIKALLSNGAATVIQFDEEMKAYYQRKLKEGKPKMVVINAVRAKLINRVFATINRGTEYVVFKQYGKAA
ncbi:MAG: IS110 family transposase, partial [Cyclobacteriaceae bacterium]